MIKLKQQETLAQVRTNLHKENLNLQAAVLKGDQTVIASSKKTLKELAEKNKKLTDQVNQQASKALEKATKTARKESAGIEKVLRKVKKQDTLTDAEKFKISKKAESLQLDIHAAKQIRSKKSTTIKS